ARSSTSRCDMTLVAIIAILLLALAVAFGFVAVAEPRVRRSEKLGMIDVYGYSAPAGSDLAVAPARRTLDGLAGSIGDFLAKRFKSLREDEVQKRLIAAGYYQLGARRFLGYRVLFTVAVTLLLIWLLILAGTSGGGVFLLALVFAGIAWMSPSFYIGHRMRTRLDEIDYSMPELIDLLVVILEAGVAFTAAMRIA